MNALKASAHPFRPWKTLFFLTVAALLLTSMMLFNTQLARADTLVRTTSGKIAHTHFSGTSLPSWLTPVTYGPSASVTVANGCCTDKVNPGDYAYVVKTDALPSVSCYVIRTKAMLTAANPDTYIAWPGVADSPVRPSADLRSTNGGGRPIIKGRFFDGYFRVRLLWDDTDFFVDPEQYAWGNTWYLNDLSYDGNTFYGSNRDFPSFAVRRQGSGYFNYTNPTIYPWFGIGNGDSIGENTANYDYLQIFSSYKLNVTGLSPGNAVRLFDQSGTLESQGTESAGTATLDMLSTVDGVPCDLDTNPDHDSGGFKGTIEVYSDNTFANLICSYSADDIWGGDTYTLTKPPPTVTSITPNSGTQGTIVSISNLAGTNFYGTPIVKLRMSSQSDITASSVNVVSPTQITCVFDLTGAAPGSWDVFVQNPDGQSATLSV